MADYSFESLAPYDLEILAQDLLSEKLNVKFESYPIGRDSGIDLRYSEKLENTIIVQCKHYRGSKYTDLEKTLREEIVKIEKIKPKRYILVTTLGLNPDRKKKIADILSPYVKEYSDIVDKNALNALIREYPAIERKHYKLWLTSTEVLKTVMQSGLYNRTEIELEDIKTRSKLYVQNEGYFEALKILEEIHCCIISGEPGIGKTTLARILCMHYITKNYKFVCLDNMEESIAAISKGEKQVFLCDDFLGSTNLKNSTKSDHEFERFLRYVENDTDKRIVLTTREYVFKEAQNKSEIYARKSIEKFLLKQEHYTKKIRAKILYNHLYFSGISKKYLEGIQKDKNYLKIINHKNFSPRIVEIMTTSKNIVKKDGENYFENFIKTLNNPEYLWKIAFQDHISTISRSLVILLGFCDDKVILEDFKELLNIWNFADTDIVERDLQIRRSIDELEGTFIKIEEYKVQEKFETYIKPIIQFSNPSVKDFVLGYIRNTDAIVKKFVSMRTLFWDQSLPMLTNLKLDKNHDTEKLECLNNMYNNIDGPTLGIEIWNNIIFKNANILKKLNWLIHESKKIKNDGKRLFQEKISELIKSNLNQFKTWGLTFLSVISWYIEFTNAKGDERLHTYLRNCIEDAYEYNELLNIYKLLCMIGDEEQNTETRLVIFKKMLEMFEEYDKDQLCFFNQFDGDAFGELVEGLGKEQDEQIQRIQDVVYEAEEEYQRKLDETEIEKEEYRGVVDLEEIEEREIDRIFATLL